jgi:hypothetical protein
MSSRVFAAAWGWLEERCETPRTARGEGEDLRDPRAATRATIPEEIKQARWIVKEREEMLGRPSALHPMGADAYLAGARGATHPASQPPSWLCLPRGASARRPRPGMLRGRG